MLPSIAKHDAISQHVLRIDDELKRREIPSTIIAEHIDPQLAERAQTIYSAAALDGPILYHLSISSPMAQYVLDSDQDVNLWYHNITPPALFEEWEPFVALELRNAFMQRSQLSLRARKGVAASEFSRSDLIHDGCRHTSTMPILFDPKEKIYESDDRLDDELAQMNGPIVLTVGRIAPHKRIDKAIASFIHFRRNFSPNATMHLIGSSASQWYMESLTEYVDKAGESKYIVFHGAVDDSHLASFYKAADLYLCTSAHEGFCVPLLEAMFSGVPIVASRSGAIEETLSGGGLLMDTDARAFEYACAMDLLVNDEGIREAQLLQARKRIEEIDLAQEVIRSVDWVMESC